MSRKTVILPKGRRARMGSPWIFANELKMDPAAKALVPGSIVNVRGEDGRAFGTGYFNPRSLIAVRLLADDCDIAVDADFFAARIARALALRTALYDKPFYRLVHAEGDHLPGLVVDRFDDVLTVQVGTAGMEKQIDAILVALDQTVKPKTVILRNDAPSRTLEGLKNYVRTARGEGARIAVEENGARYRRPAGITTSATTAPSSLRWPRAGRCSTPIPMPAASASWRRRPGRRKSFAWILPRPRWRWPRKAPRPMA
jgi:23S rRNA (cytosine1962-C5)-methyltransferase